MSQTNLHQYALIMAGGAGTRLWPLSRKSRPKQFQAFTDEQTLLQHMVSLALTVVPLERILIMATEEFSETIRGQVTELPTENLLFEPARRDNGPAFLLGALELQLRDPQAVMAVLWSDHLIQNPEGFTSMLAGAFAAAEARPESLVTVGANPTSPDPTLGYIQMGREAGEFKGTSVFTVRRFIEKPDTRTAERFVASWDYLWNVGYKIMCVAGFLNSLNAVRPDLEQQTEELRKAVSSADHSAVAAAYEALTKESIEYMYTQHVKELLVVPADLGWSDLGNWNVLHEVLSTDTDQSMALRGEVVSISSSNCLAFAKDRPIALVGVRNLIVVDDGDCILVMHKEATNEIKAVGLALEPIHPELL